jgi:plastocyanin
LCSVFLLSWAGQAFAVERVVMQQDKTFSEIFVKVDSEGVVRFVNDDSVRHVLTFRGKNTELLSKEIEPGKSQLIRFSKPGLYDIQCQSYPDMKLTVFVSFVDKVASN